MDASIQNSSLPPRNFPKAHLTVDSASYGMLDLGGLDVGDEVVYVVRGEIKEKSVSQFEKDGRKITIVVKDITDQSPRTDRDQTNRLT